LNPTFINYRRADSQPIAELLHKELSKHLGIGKVFRDATDISPGSVFSNVIRRKLEESGAMIVLIGPTWTSDRRGDKRRLHVKTDFVRKEIEVALKRKILIIPVLVNDARLSTKSELPTGLQSLLGINVERVDKTSVKRVAKRLAKRISDDGMHLVLKQRTRYAGKDRSDPEEDWWDWSIHLDGPPTQLKTVTWVDYHLHHEFGKGPFAGGGARTKFKLEKEGYDGFRIKAVVYRTEGRRHFLFHELILRK
jgi:hypothetical protein